MKKPKDHAEPTKVERLKKNQKKNRNVQVVGSSLRCFLEQETLPLLLSTG